MPTNSTQTTSVPQVTLDFNSPVNGNGVPPGYFCITNVPNHDYQGYGLRIDENLKTETLYKADKRT